LSFAVSDIWFSALNRQNTKCLSYWHQPHSISAIIIDLIRPGAWAVSIGYKGKTE